MSKGIPTTFQLNSTTTIKLKKVPRRPNITEITRKGLLVKINFWDLDWLKQFYQKAIKSKTIKNITKIPNISGIMIKIDENEFIQAIIEKISNGIYQINCYDNESLDCQMILISMSGCVPKIAYNINDTIFAKDINQKLAQLISNTLTCVQGYLSATNFVVSKNYNQCSIEPLEIFGKKL